MSSTRHTKCTNENLVFVKNVPQDMAKDTVPRVFVQYGAIECRNLYPNSQVTTLMVGFKTAHIARLAQEATEGMRLEHIILKVEIYNNYRSSRFLEDNGHDERPLNSEEAHDDTVGLQDSVSDLVQYPALGQERNAGRDLGATTKGKSRADVAMDMHSPATLNPPTILSVPPEGRMIGPTTPVHIAPDQPQRLKSPTFEQIHSLGNSPTEPHLSRGVSSTSSVTGPATPDNQVYGIIAAHDTMKCEYSATRTQPAQVLEHHSDSWIPVDTTTRLRQQHSQNCSFCQLGKRVQKYSYK